MALIVFFLLVGGQGSFAHSVVIYAGRIVWNESELRIQFEIDAHLIEHERRALGRSIGSGELGRFLADAITVSDEYGDRLPVAGIETANDGNGATLIYSSRQNTSAVAIHYRPTGRFAALQRQFQLRFVRGKEAPALIRLTSQFNHGVVVRQSGNESDALTKWRDTPSIRVLPQQADVPALHVDIPGSLVGEYMGLTVHGPTISTAWLKRNRGQITDWLGESIVCVDEKGVDLGCSSQSIAFLLPDGSTAGAPEMSLNILTTRLRISVAATNWPANRVGYLAWRGFTHGVLRMAVIDHGDPSRHLPDLTPMQNVLRIDGSDSGEMELRVEAAADRPTTHGATDAG